MSVNEWPAPTGLTRRPSAAARFITALSSASDVGRSTEAGAHRWFPAQLLHVIRRSVRPTVLRRRTRTLAPVLRRRRSGSGLQGFDELRQDLVDVAHDAEVG